MVQTWFGPDKLTPRAGATQFPGLCKLGLGLASPEYQHRTQVLWQLSILYIVKYSFSMTKKESSNKDCVVVFLAEKEEEIVVDELMAVEEEKITIWTRTCTSIRAIVAKG